MDSSTQTCPKSPYKFVFLGIFFLGLGIRLIGLEKGIWLDEYTSLSVIFSENFVEALRVYDHPPLYFVLLKAWSQMGNDEWFLRLPSVVFGIGTVAIVIMWTKQYSALAGALSGLCCATMPIMLRYSQEIRGYSLLLLTTSLCFFFASRLVAEPRKVSGYLGLTLSLTAAIATHLVGILLVTTVCLFILITLVDYKKILFHKLILTLSIPFISFIFLYFFFLQRPNEDNWWMPLPSLELIMFTAKYVLGAPSVFWLLPIVQDTIPLLAVFLGRFILLVACLVGSMALLGNWRRSLPSLVSAVFYWLQLLIYSFLMTPIFWYRTVLPGIIPFLGFLGLQIATIQKSKAKIASILGLILLTLNCSTYWVISEAKKPYEQWKQMAQLLDQHWEPGDFVIFCPPYAEGPIRYYKSDLPSEAAIGVDIGADIEKLKSEIRERVLPREEHGTLPTVFLMFRHELAVREDPEAYHRLLEYLESEFGQVVFSASFGPLSLSKYESR